MAGSPSQNALNLGTFVGLAFGASLVAALAPGCSGAFRSCRENRTCASPEPTNAGAGGEGAAPVEVPNENGGAGAPSTDVDASGGSGGSPTDLGEETEAGAGGERQVALCGNGRRDPGEECDQGAQNAVGAYGEGHCTDACKLAPYCGDGNKNGSEKCDESVHSTELGACNPECTGFYEKKFIRNTFSRYPAGDLGGIAGADAKCRDEFGQGWKALLIGGGRRATKTPFLGDDANDWVVHKYTHYFNYFQSKLVWRTDAVPLLGVRDGARVNLYADAYQTGSEYPWSGWRADWTTVGDDDENQGTCNGWTSTTSVWGSFAFADLRPAASETCTTSSFLLCVEQ